MRAECMQQIFMGFSLYYSHQTLMCYTMSTHLYYETEKINDQLRSCFHPGLNMQSGLQHDSKLSCTRKHFTFPRTYLGHYFQLTNFSDFRGLWLEIKSI